jgi:hypothetical protein
VLADEGGASTARTRRTSSTEPDDVDERSPLSERLAAWTFALAVVVAVPVIFHAAREQWFFLDEWDFLADRDLLSLDDLLRPHNEHWSTLPIVAYRLVWQVVGLEHYWPYLALTVAAHLVLAVLLRVTMRRAGVHPWIATAAASLFAVFGGGRENITWAFQVGFTGALAFGVAALLLADHDGRDLRRDVPAVACAVASLMCAGLGITMAGCLAVSVLVRRGWRAAALVVAPLAAGFVIWYLGWGHEGGGVETAFDDRALRLAADVVESTSARLGAVSALGWGLGVAALVGVVLAVRRIGLAGLRRTHAPVVGLVAGAVAFLLITGVGRAVLSVESTSRYRHVLAALLLPAIGVGLTELGRRWAPATWVAVALLVVAIPVNARDLEATVDERITLGNPAIVVALGNLEAPPGMPRSARPLPEPAHEITVGWLADARADGKVPDWDEAARAAEPTARLLLALEPVVEAGGEGCRAPRALQGARLETGQVLRVASDSVTVVEVVDGRPAPVGATFVADPLFGPAFDPAEDGPEIRLRAHRPMVLQVRAPGARRPTEVCASA